VSTQNTYLSDSNIHKNNIVKTANDTIVKDTVYGIDNELAIPHRNVEIKEVPKTKTEVEILFNPTYKKTDIQSWQTVLLLFGLFLVGFTKAFSNNRFKQSIKALFNYSVAQEITREEKVFFHRANLLLTLNHIVILSLFIFHLNNILHFNHNKNSLGIFLLIAAFIVLMYSIKYIFSKVLFYVFNDSNIANEYIFNISLFNNFLGILFIPVMALCYFSELSLANILTYFALPLIAISFIMRGVRMFVAGKLKGVSYFYIFLYICTLEILPLVVLYRFFILK